MNVLYYNNNDIYVYVTLVIPQFSLSTTKRNIHNSYLSSNSYGEQINVSSPSKTNLHYIILILLFCSYYFLYFTKMNNGSYFAMFEFTYRFRFVHETVWRFIIFLLRDSKTCLNVFESQNTIYNIMNNENKRCLYVMNLILSFNKITS